MHLRARSPAARRLLTLATSLPFDHPAFSQDVMEARCKPVGYFQMYPDTVGHEDVYNTCLLRWGGRAGQGMGTLQGSTVDVECIRHCV